MKIKNKVNIRRDIVTNKRYQKDELIRMVITKDNEVFFNNNKVQGRGFYLHPDSLQKAKDKEIIKKYLSKRNINISNQDIIDKL